MKARKERFLTFPMARNPLSKKRKIPINVNRTPNPVNPSPISVSYIIYLRRDYARTGYYLLLKRIAL